MDKVSFNEIILLEKCKKIEFFFIDYFLPFRKFACMKYKGKTAQIPVVNIMEDNSGSLAEKLE